MQPCIRRFDRVFDGNIGSTMKSKYTCKAKYAWQRGVETSLFATTLGLRITAGLDCDESEQYFPSLKLEGEGSTVVRNDGFAHFFGTCSIVKYKEGQLEITYFKGNIELIGKTGSHQSLGELCNQNEHIEGWLDTPGQGVFSDFKVKAIIVCKGNLPDALLDDLSINRISGSLVKGG